MSKVRFGTIVNFLNAKRKPLSSKERENKSGIYPYYGASDIVDYIDEYIFNGTYLLISEDGENLKSRKTPIAFIANGKFWVNNHAHIVEGKDDETIDYLKYYFSQLDLSPYITGAVQPKLSKGVLEKIEIDFPSYEIRKSINQILGLLDDKIQLNTQTNQTLEAIAQAIFKSWFVDFDPVRAKAQAILDGKTNDEANLSAMAVISGKAIEDLSQTEYQELWEIADAFPSELVENAEFGEVPKGWELTTFGEVAECFDRKRIPLSKKQREEKQGTIPYYGATSIMDYVDEAIFDDIYLLIGEDGSVLKADGTPFIQYIWGKSWVNNHAHVLQGKNDISTEHLMTFIRTENISAYVTGAVQMKLNQANMNKIPFLKANDKVNIYFDDYLKSLYSAFRNNIEENRNLEKTRDLLLPKLLSGEMEL